MIEDPVKRCGAEHRVGLLADRQRGRVCDKQLTAPAMPLQICRATAVMFDD
jgi:hypothetical protein